MTVMAKVAILSWCVYALAAPGSSCRRRAATHPAAAAVEIRWDRYGVPHVFADDTDAVFYAFGWAQMESHANLILGFYGKARGRGAEYWGKAQLASDVTVRLLEIPETAAAWYAAQDDDFKRYITRFVAGMNDWAAAHPEAIRAENRAVLPIEPADPFAHLQCVLDVGFIGRPVLGNTEIDVPMGSNALAIAPWRMSDRHAVLMTNPHLPWNGIYTFYEAHFKLGARDLYGATLVGLPVLVLGFNNSLGWAHTSNGLDGADLYEIDLIDADHYRFDGKTTPLETRTKTLLVKASDGSLERRQMTAAYTRHGPVLRRQGSKAFAYRSTRTLYPLLFKQYWEMVTATDLSEFQRALRRMQLPLFNIVYADRAGHIMFRWNGLLPRRGLGDTAYWVKDVPGDRSDTLWQGAFPYGSLPQVINPSSGWLQNTNDPPWSTTLPAPLDPKRFPAFIPPAEPPSARTERLFKMLTAARWSSFDTVRAIKFDNRVEMADRLLDELLAVADATPLSQQPQTLQAALRVLRGWDRTTDADSRGAVLFKAWTQQLGEQLFDAPIAAPAPGAPSRRWRDPAGVLGKLAKAADEVMAQYGALDVPWGDVHRLRRGDFDLPANGGPGYLGIVHSVEFRRGDAGRFGSLGGDSYSAVVEFSTPVRAEVLLSYGNSSEERSRHYGDQLSLLARKQMRRALLTASEIEHQLVRRERLPLGAAHP
jgi:acyl-homoserine-lactone acylase